MESPNNRKNTLIVGIGTGYPLLKMGEEKDGSTRIQRAIAKRIVEIVKARPEIEDPWVEKDPTILLVGGNGPEPCREAEVLRRLIQTALQNQTPYMLTDCDTDFEVRFNLLPSTDTLKNAINIAAVAEEQRTQRIEIVAHEDHIGRVIRNTRWALKQKGLLGQIEISPQPIQGHFLEWNNAQWQLMLRPVFQIYDKVAGWIFRDYVA